MAATFKGNPILTRVFSSESDKIREYERKVDAAAEMNYICFNGSNEAELKEFVKRAKTNVRITNAAGKLYLIDREEMTEIKRDTQLVLTTSGGVIAI